MINLKASRSLDKNQTLLEIQKKIEIFQDFQEQFLFFLMPFDACLVPRLCQVISQQLG